MLERIAGIEAQIERALESIESVDDPALLRKRFLGKKGELSALRKGMRDLPPAQRPEVGARINAVVAKLEDALEARLADFEKEGGKFRSKPAAIDITLPGRKRPRGSLSPLTLVLRDITRIFENMGFVVEDGPEVETDHYNFGALNFPPDHPSRDMQDTLFVTEDILLRTHTSPVQIRVMERMKPPVRMICPGWVYRSDTLDASHSPMFSQVEGLLVDRHVTMGDLFGVINEFVHRFFGRKIETRYRPSFFPFTEPSAEVDVTCVICRGSGKIRGAPCRVCRGSGWKEVMGCGMVDPNVFLSVGYDPEEYTGFAFGMGIERLAMFQYGVDEIRHFFEGDLRFLTQF